MKVVVISSTEISSSREIELMKQLFNEGLETFHLRRPTYDYKKMRDYLNRIPEEFHNKIVIHSHPKLALKYNLKGIHVTSKVRKKQVQILVFKTFCDQ